MTLAYSYVRMSNESQLHGDSLRRQTELSAAYASKNSLTLVEEFRLHDLGVSAFKGVNGSSGALRLFLDAIESGEVAAGSYLLVESLDRLSRDKISSAMQQFLSITQAGVNIVTLSDQQVYRAGADFPQLVYSLAVMSRANEESQIKSKRVGAAWSNKRDNAAVQKLTRLCPAWLQLDASRTSFSIIEGRDKIVLELFEKSAAGQGSNSLTRELNARHVPPFGSSVGWVESYVTKILQNRAVLGEFQPHHFVEGKRIPVGDAIQGYFPRIVDDGLFFRVQAARRSRTTGAAGRKGTMVSNLFGNIATCEYCGASMRMVNKGYGPKGGRYLRCSASLRGMGCVATSWRYDDFETSFLLFAKEIDLGGVLNASANQAARAQLQHRLTASQERLRDLRHKRERTFELHIEGNSAFLASKLAEYEDAIGIAEAEVTALVGELTSISSPTVNPAEIKEQIDALRTFTGADAFTHRLRLTTRLREIVTSLTIAVDGKRPQIAETRKMLLEQEPDEQYRTILLEAIDKGYQETDAYQPTFQVMFADGISRRVVVDENDPTRLLVEAVIDVNGDATVRRHGSSDWHLPRPLSTAEIDEILEHTS